MTSIPVPGNVAVTLDLAVEARLDRMAAQLEELTAELRLQRQEREAVREFLSEPLGEYGELILDTLREMTRPDVMQVVQKAAHLVNDPPAEPAEAPSVLALMRQLGDPETRRGLARVIAMLHTVGERPHSHGHHPAGPHQTHGAREARDHP